MIIVADSSPLIALSRVGRLELLRSVYGTVIVPDAVWAELVLDGEGRAGAAMVKESAWIIRHAAQHREVVKELEDTLDPGECEAIALAQEIGADALLMDEQLGRAAALHLGLKVTGLLGVLLAAKEMGLLLDAFELAKEMQRNGWWVADHLIVRLR
jgi:predicted nucleic acid-binding protein